MTIPQDFSPKESSVNDNVQQQQEAPSQKRASLREKATKISLGVAGLGVLFVFLVIFSAYAALKSFNIDIPKSIAVGIGNVIGTQLKTDSNGHTNILMVGVGGGNHDGPDLTDTIQLVSINQSDKSVAMLSIPRDLYVMVPKHGGTKINGVYDIGLKMQKPVGYQPGEVKSQEDVNAAMGLLSSTVEDITGMEIQYYVQINFQGFKETVDLVGGVEVDVPERFVDRNYPNETETGVTTFFLREGLQTMDGDTALKYARSRYSTSDYDRAHRQQVLMKALLKKVTTKEILTNPSQLRRMFLTVSNNITTDLEWREIVTLASLASTISTDSIANQTIHDDPSKIGGLLYNPNRDYFGGAAVSLPVGATPSDPSNYKNIQFFANMYFNNPGFFANPPKVVVLNGTLVSGKRVGGIATSAKTLFAQYGIDVMEVGNTPTGTSAEQTLFFYSNKDNEKHLQNLSLFAPGKSVYYDPTKPASGMYADIIQELQTRTDGADIYVVVGNDYREYLLK